ncbi:hypothetical protein TSAR_014418 [Trichomalopsis sarcophagae]|uniref:Uncharacterized protein n=1 Tax=Trichomalopsis sarcophagae TaxID=543379 RepID=A0A232EQ28_9HYME|nr:hypothetical protein TSAR_014418 [Trichomalopsis sarcophagae]
MTTTESKSSGSTSSLGCRICYEDGTSEELIEPCECSGTLGLIHASCLERWLSTWNTDRCEICKYGFAVERRNKPLPQSFWQWWRTRGVYGPQGVTGDAICLVVLTPLCFATTYLCGVGVTAYSRLGFWEGTGLAVLCCMLVATYFLWFFVTIRFHYKSWRQWCKRNQDVKLLVKCKLSEEERKESKKNEDEDRDGQDSEIAQRNYGFGRVFLWLNFSFAPDTEPVYNFHQQTTFV